jgi:hypothetical protein
VKLLTRVDVAPGTATVIASVIQRTSDDETFYVMTAMANRRPLQVKINQRRSTNKNTKSTCVTGEPFGDSKCFRQQ